MENPLVLYRQWFAEQYVVWADMVALAAMDCFDALCSHTSFGDTMATDRCTDDYQRGEHSLRLLDYIDHTLAKRNTGLTALVASLLFESTQMHIPFPTSESEYREERDAMLTRYHQALADGDVEAIAADEDYLDTVEEDYEARRLMNASWQAFSATAFNLDTIAAFER